MSADNGIYILKTPRPGGGVEFRPCHQMAIENVSWDGNGDSSDYRVHIENAREMWKGAEVFTDEGEAFVHAQRLAEREPILEYGISTISIPIPFEPGSEFEPVGKATVSNRQHEALSYAVGLLERDGRDGYAHALRVLVKAAEAEGEAFEQFRSVQKELQAYEA